MPYILTLSCHDRHGIVAAVTTFLAERQLNILESAQYGDPFTTRFFMRVHFGSPAIATSVAEIREAFRKVAESLGPDAAWEIHTTEQKVKAVILVSKIGHCLNDLLFRVRTGALPIEVPLIVSNHDEYASLAASYGIRFERLAWSKDVKRQAEARLLELIKEYSVDLVVLARFMQIMSADFCRRAPSIVNIHHSFLPSFIGAKPYHQAFERGVKRIGATAHFATADLDEGPIIEQDTIRITHAMTAADLVQQGATVECKVLASAVKSFAERRILLNGHKTVIF